MELKQAFKCTIGMTLILKKRPKCLMKLAVDAHKHASFILSLEADQQPAKGESHTPHSWEKCFGCLVAWFQNYNLTGPLRGGWLAA